MRHTHRRSTESCGPTWLPVASMLERTPGILARCLCMDDDDAGRAACDHLKAPATRASLVVRPPKSAVV